MATEVAPAAATKRPRRDLLGPILRWELITIPRRRRYYFIRVLYASLLLFVLWTVYSVTQIGSGTPTIASMAQFSEGFFYAFIYVQLGAVLLLTPAFVASGISVEKERRTLEFLFATDLSNREIVFGKLFARSLNLFTILMVGVPILAFAGLLGGIDYTRLGWATAASAAIMMFIASLALTISVHSRTTRQALTNTYVMVLFLLFLPAGVMLTIGAAGQILFAADRELWEQFWQFLANPTVVSAQMYGLLIHPVGVLILATEPELIIRSTTGREDLAYLINIGANLVVAALLTLFATARLRRAYRYDQAVVQRRWGFRRLFQPYRLFRPSVWQNWPVAWKEIHAGSYRSMGCLTRIVLVLGGLAYYGLVLGNFFVNPSDDDILAFGVMSGNILFGSGAFLLVAFRAATTIGQERDRDCWVSLLSTPVSASEILFSKWLAALTPVFWTSAFLAPIWFVAVWSGALGLWNILSIFVVLLINSAFLAAVGVYQSLRRQTTIQAIAVTLAIGIVCFGAGQSIVASFPWRDPDVYAAIWSSTPYFALAMATFLSSAGEWDSKFYSDWIEQVIISQICFLALAVLIAIAAVLLFPKATGRGESARARLAAQPPIAST